MLRKSFTTSRKIIFSSLSGLLMGLSYYYMVASLAWFALVPLLVVIFSEKPSRVFKFGFLAGLVQSLIMYSWMVKVVAAYMGKAHPPLAFLLFLLSILYAALYMALFSWMVSLLTKIFRKNIIILLFAGTLIWVGLELFKDKLFGNALPWFSYPFAISQAKVLPIAGLVSLGSVYFLSIILVVVNFLLAFYFLKRKNVFFLLAIGIFLLNILAGFMLTRSEKSLPGGKNLKVVLLSENIAANVRWNDQTGDSLVNIFFRLNRETVQDHPDLIVWSETAVPWTYRKEDPFLKKVFSIQKEAWQLIGMLQNGPYDGSVYNTAGLFGPNGHLIDRYQKNDLLAALEKPLFPGLSGTKLSFLAQGLMDNVVPGIRREPLESPLGKLGVLICNESLLPEAAHHLKKKGSQLLVVMSNDGWFDGTQVALHHFYFNRFRALENHLPVIVNSNMGTSGIIDARGNILVKKHSDRPFILQAKVTLSPGLKRK